MNANHRSAYRLILAIATAPAACDSGGAGGAREDGSVPPTDAAPDTAHDVSAGAGIDASKDVAIDATMVRDAGGDPVTSRPDTAEAGADSAVTVFQVPPQAPINTVSPGQNRPVVLGPAQASANPCGWLGVESATSAALTPDGALLVTGATDALRVYDARTGAQVRAISPGRGTVERISMSSDGTLVAAATGSPTVYRVADGTAVFTAPPGAYQHGPVALSPDGTRLAFEGFTLGTVDTWDIASGQNTSMLPVPSGVVIQGLAYSARGDWLAVSFPTHHLQLWSVATHQNVTDGLVDLGGSMYNDVSALSFSPDGAFIGASSDDRAMVYHVPSLAPLNQDFFKGVPVFSADSTRVAVLSPRGGIDIDALTDGQYAVVLEHIAPSLATSLLAFSPADDHVALAGPHALAVQSLGTSQVIWSADGNAGAPTLAPDGHGFFGLNVAGELRSWSARGQTQSVVQTPLTMQNPLLIHYVTTFDISPDGHRVAALMPYDVETVSLDQVNASSPLAIDPQSNVGGPIRFSPDGASVMAIDASGPTEWGAMDARRRRVFQKDPLAVEAPSARYSPDGALLVAGGPVMDVWRRADGTLLHRLQSTAPQASVNALAFSPSGATLATCDAGGTLSLWDTSSWTMPLATRPYDQRCTVAFTADGKGVLTWSENDAAVRLWSSADLSPIAAMPALGISPYFVGVATTSTGQQVAGVEMDGFTSIDDRNTFLYCLPAIP